MERSIDVISLIGTENIHISYNLCRDRYGDDFDSQMADMVMVVIGMQGEYGFAETILQLILAKDESFTPDQHDNFDHKLKSALMWYILELPFLKNCVQNLKKVLGDVK